jgi:preprotein translocase subunit SecG
LIALSLIVLILIQHGKGADAGAAFGSGASSTVFGSQGSGSFLTRLTAILATVFFLTSLYLAYLSNSTVKVTSDAIPKVTQPAPAKSDVPATKESLPARAVQPGGDVPTDVPAAPVEKPAQAPDKK